MDSAAFSGFVSVLFKGILESMWPSVGCFYLIGGTPESALFVRWGVIHRCRDVAVLSVAFLYECYGRENEWRVTVGSDTYQE